MEFKIQEIVWSIEETVIDYKSNKRFAVQIFRNCQCLRDDFRSYSIVSDTFNYLTYAFSRNDGQIPLTNTLAKLGDIVSKTLSLKNQGKSAKLQLGSIVLEALIDKDYITLHREEYMTYEQLLIKGEKVRKRMQPYHLELGEQFRDVKFLIKERLGISTTKYPEWDSNERMVLGVKDRLVKGTIKISKGIKKPFLKAINNLEKVRWEVNPDIAQVSKQLEALLIDSSIEVITEDGEIVRFESSDIKRIGANEKYKNVNLYYNDILFEPDLGNAAQVKIIEAKLASLEKRYKRIKTTGELKDSIKKQIDTCMDIYEEKNRHWLAKQLCLRKRSHVNRDQFILNTIHGCEEAPGWLGSKFYLSSFLDFRGRVYARDPYFSYQSSDLARGHLMFAEKKLMTDKGYRHLLAHLANSYNQSYTIEELKDLDWTEQDYAKDLIIDGIPDISVDKMTIKDRELWSENSLDFIFDVALDPIESREQWMQAEKPWVFLSLCFEVIKYLAEDGEYFSQMPIAIDGASNGTQHLAAMSKDEIAGAMVGLIPTNKPIDFYIVIAKGILNRNVDNDLGKILAQIPMKLIRKGISKRGTMTKAYDAGVRCIANIIYTDCYDAGMTVKYGITRSVSSKLAKDLVDTYNSLCSGPVAVKDYLQALTKHRIKELNYRSSEWDTPSGFHVISEKWITSKKQVVVRLNKNRIGIVYREVTSIPAIHEITSGISPNYVHSMDASHMSLVINELNDAGIYSFGAIHDSFSVHADDVDTMLDITKSVFISMYDHDVFTDMKKQFVGNDENFTIDKPDIGKLDLNRIKESEYFFC